MEDDSKLLALITATFGFTILYGLFVLLSVAIVRSRRSQVRKLLKGDPAKFNRIRRLLGRASHYLLCTQLGRFLAGVGVGLCVLELVISAEVKSLLGHLAPQWATIAGGALFAGTVLLAMVLVLTSVQVAKGVAYANPERVLVLFSRPLVWFTNVLTPLVVLPSMVAASLLRVFGLSLPVEREAAVSAEELSEIVERSSELGALQEDEREMIQGIVGFSETLVREIMTPRADIVSIKDTDDLETVRRVFLSEGFSRVVVIGEELDDVRGILNGKELIPLVGVEPASFDIRPLIRKPVFVHGNQPIDEVLEELQRQATHIAIVLDEHGGVDGLVTLENIIEEIIGDIFDEYDSPEEEEEVQETKSGDLLVDGGMAVDDLNQLHGFSFPNGEYDTVAGFVIHWLGYIPDAGESFDFDGVGITIEEASQNRITLVRITPQPQTQPQPAKMAS